MTYLQNQIENLIRIAQEEEGYEPYYEVLEYISLDGTQYFNPDLLTNADYTIEARFKLTDTSSSSSVFGGRNSSANPMNGNQLHYIYMNGKTQYIGGYSNPELAVENAITVNDVCEVVCDKTGFSIAKNGGTPTKYSRAFSAVQYTTDLMIGATYTKTGETIQFGFKGEFYMFKVRLSGELIRDYVPALDNKMRPCLYDRVSKTFLYAKKISNGTTTYDLGFKRWNKFDVDYIQSSGTEYINTGFKFTNTSAFEITCAEVADFEASTVLCGARNNTDTTSNARIVDYSYSAPSVLRGEYLLLQRGGYNVNENVIYIPYDTEFHTYYQSPTRMSIDDTDRPTVPSLTSPNMDFYIFWQNVGTATAPAKAKIKVKSQKLWDNGTLVRDFKPSVRTYNDGTSVVTKAFLYDEVYNKAYDNAGTGSFKAYIEADREVYNLAMHDSMDITIGGGAYINANGVVTTDNTSCYTKAIPVKEGDVITLTVTGKATTDPYNKRIHGYTSDDGEIPVKSKGSWVQQLDLINFPAGQTKYTTQQKTVTVPSGINYIRLSHCVIIGSTQTVIETQCDITITRTYEVGKSVSALPSSSISGVSNCFDTGLYGTQDTTVKHIAIAYDNPTSSGQLFGAYDGSTSTSKNLTINSTGTGSTAPIRFDGQAITTAIKIPINQSASIVTNRYGLWVDNTLHGSWGDVNDFTTLTTLLILKCNNSTNVRNNGCCYCLILEKDVPIAEYIPVRNVNNTSVYGLYDRVSKELNTGSGTINFNALD